MGDSFNEWENLRFVDFEVGSGFPMTVKVLLRFPTLDQHEEFWLVLGMVDLESCTAWFLPGQRSLLDEKFLDFFNIGFVFNCQENVTVDHGAVSVADRWLVVVALGVVSLRALASQAGGGVAPAGGLPFPDRM